MMNWVKANLLVGGFTMAIAFVLMTILSPARAESEEKRVALVIGNSDYEHVADLMNPTNDSEDLAAALTRIGFEVTSRQNIDDRQMRLALRDFGEQAAQADIALIYFAGHGIEIANTNYLIPINAELKSDRDIEFEAIQLDMVVNLLAGSSGLKMVLVDACRNNPFVSSMTRTSATRSIGRGLARVEPGGVLVGYAARGGTLAQDGDGRNSPYVAALLEHIEQPGLELGKMFRKVRDSVYSQTDGHQEPFTYGSLPGNDIFLVLETRAAAIAPMIQGPSNSDRDNIAAGFANADNANTLANWDSFLDEFAEFRSHPLLRLALAKRQQLQDRQSQTQAPLEDDTASREALGIQDELIAYSAAEKLATPRAWALYFDKFPNGRLSQSAVVREEAALLDDIRARVFGRYRSASDGEMVTTDMRRSALELLDLDERIIRQMQTALNSRGNKLGKTDGKIGPKTITALQAVQRASGLPVTGIPTRATLAELSRFEDREPAGSLFMTSGAMSRVFGADTLAVLESDARLYRVVSAFRGRRLIYGFFEDHLYVAVYLGTTIGEETLRRHLENSRSQLVEIQSAAEHDFLVDLIGSDLRLWTSGSSSISHKSGPTIGLAPEKENWKWRSGNQIGFSDWASGEPRSYGGSQAYGRLAPYGKLPQNAHNVTRARWATQADISFSIILEIE